MVGVRTGAFRSIVCETRVRHSVENAEGMDVAIFSPNLPACERRASHVVLANEAVVFEDIRCVETRVAIHEDQWCNVVWRRSDLGHDKVDKENNRGFPICHARRRGWVRWEVRRDVPNVKLATVDLYTPRPPLQQ